MQRFAVPMLLALVMPGALMAQQGDADYTWAERVNAGAWLRVHTLHGDVRVVEGSGDRAEVRGLRSGDDAAEIRITAVRDDDGVTICAMWEGGQCDREGIHTPREFRRRSHDGQVDFEVRLPRGVKIRALSGNGDVRVSGATAEVYASSGNGDVSVASTGGPVRASSGNGDIDVSRAGGEVSARSGNGDIRVSTTQGPVSASTGNGTIEARMTSIAGTDDMAFRTGNGDIVLMLPENFNGEIEARLPNGRLESDFPLRIEGRLDPRRLRATIGTGGRRVTLVSGSGGAEIRKSG